MFLRYLWINLMSWCCPNFAPSMTLSNQVMCIGLLIQPIEEFLFNSLILVCEELPRLFPFDRRLLLCCVTIWDAHQLNVTWTWFGDPNKICDCNRVFYVFITIIIFQNWKLLSLYKCTLTMTCGHQNFCSSVLGESSYIRLLFANWTTPIFNSQVTLALNVHEPDAIVHKRGVNRTFKLPVSFMLLQRIAIVLQHFLFWEGIVLLAYICFHQL